MLRPRPRPHPRRIHHTLREARGAARSDKYPSGRKNPGRSSSTQFCEPEMASSSIITGLAVAVGEIEMNCPGARRSVDPSSADEAPTFGGDKSRCLHRSPRWPDTCAQVITPRERSPCATSLSSGVPATSRGAGPRRVGAVAQIAVANG